MLLNVDLLVACILIVLVSILYIFYWNRFLGHVLSFLLRLTLWNQSSSAVWVDIGSAHLSLLAGRVIFKDVRYHSSNQTLRIVKCQISWRYWIRHAAEEEDLADDVDRGEDESRKTHKHTPSCRIHISLEGFEWFMYNRTAAFENVLAQLGVTYPAMAGARTKSRESHVHSLNTIVNDRDRAYYPQASTYTLGRRALSALRFPSFLDRFYAWTRRQLPDLDPKSLLPLSLEASKGAITMGNHTTENLLLAQFTFASGTYGIVQSRSTFDLHKQLLHLNFTNAVLSCVENPDYWAPVQKLGKDVHDSMSTIGRQKFSLSFRDFDKLWFRARSHFPYFKSRQRRYGNPEKEGKKKARKVEEKQSHIGADFSKLEYAIDRKLLEAPLLELTYYADVAGEVPEDPQRTGTTDLEFFDIGNGGVPPEWGIDVVTHSAIVHYGPWADRQRAQLQRVFFPPTFQHARPTDLLETGDRRLCTCLKLFFEFRGTTTVHLPFREASKNWQWDGRCTVPRDSDQREAASLQFRFSDATTLKYLVPMIATEEGYLAELDVFMDAVTLSSSLNDICLLEAASCSLSTHLPSPLDWNSERTWIFDLVLDRPVLFLIRDHINMLTDLGKDWASGPPSDYDTFVPMLYGVNLTFNDFELNFYANDHNIIDRPLDRRENVLFTYKANVLESNVTIPSNKFRPFSTAVSFVANVPNMTLLLSLPRWNTHALSSRSADDKLRHIAHFQNFCIDGSYTYHAEVREDCADQLKLNIRGHSPALKLFGWVVRHFMTWRENYFGSFTQYSTTREYLDKRDRGVAVGDPLELKYRPGKSNISHLDLSVVVESALVALPAGAPGYEKGPTTDDFSSSDSDSDIGACVVLTVPLLQVQMRLHEYFMDLSINVDPVFASVELSYSDSQLLPHSFIPSQRQLSISGVDITANRLFGPPPRNTAYVCIWNIHVGDVKGFFTIKQATILLHSGRTFMIGYSDPFNAPAVEYTTLDDRDATFLKISTGSLEGSVSLGTVTARAALHQGLELFFNNNSGTSYRKMTSLSVPVAELQMLYSLNCNRQWLEVGRFQASIGLDIYKSPSGWHQDAQLQKQFLETQDMPTKRFANVLRKGQSSDFVKWHSSLYLQEVMAPSLRKGRRFAGASASFKSHKQNRRYQHSNRAYTDFSDSDQELISEMDRDRRLADSRPNSFAIYNEASSGQSISSLHESDETNETDTDSFWSDYLESGRRSGLEGYLSFCRRFQVLHSASSPSLDNGFTVYKEAVSPRLGNDCIDFSPLMREEASVGLNASSGAQGPDDKRSRTNIRAKVDDAELFLTALVCPAVLDILNGLRKESWSPELKLDAFMLDSFPAPSPDSDSILDLEVRRLAVRLVQDLLPVDEMSEVSTRFPGTENAKHNSRVMGVLEVEVVGGRAVTSYISTAAADPKGTLSSGSFGFQTVRCLLGTQICSVTGGDLEDYSPSIVAQIDMDSLFLSFSSLSAECSLSSASLRLHHHAPEVILVASRELQTDIRQIVTARKTYVDHSRLKLQHLILLVFDCTRDKPSTDVFAAIQPSFLVQSGRPQILRQDANWKLLFHLRHMLADMPDASSHDLSAKLASGPGSLDIRRALEKYNIPWATEEGMTIMGLDVIRSLFEEPKSDTFSYMHRNDSRPVRSGGFRAGSLKLIFPEHDSSSQNSFTLSDMEVRGDLLTRRMIVLPYSLSSHTATFRSAVHNDPVDYSNLAMIITLSINTVQLTVFPTILTILQNAVHVWGALSQLAPIESQRVPEVVDGGIFGLRLKDRMLSCDVRVALRRMLLEVAAENLIFEVISRDFSSTTACYVSRPSSGPMAALDISVNHGLGFEGISVKARTRLFSEARYRENDVLAGISVSGGSMCALYQSHSPQGQVVRSTVHVDVINLNVPRSAIRLYHFVEQWRQDYLLGVDTMMKSLFSEIRQTPKRTAPRNVTKSKGTILYDFNGSITTIAIDLQVMHGTWLSWSAHEVVAFGKNQPPQQKVLGLYGLQVGSQKIGISSEGTLQLGNNNEKSSEISFILPEFCVSASSGSVQSSLLGRIGFLEMTIKPSHWDALLSVQQKFGQDFNDLLRIIGERGRKRMKSSRKPSTLPINILGKFDGFRIGLEGHSSTQFLQCDNIDAVYSVSNQRQWQVTLTDLTLYLAPNTSIGRRNNRAEKDRLPLSVSIDLRLSSYHLSAAESIQTCLDIAVTRLHAILQASMMSEIGDFVDYLQTEVLLRKEQRAIELNEFKGKARKVMETFNINPRQPSFADTGGFFMDRLVKLSVKNIVAAFPLELDSSSKILNLEAQSDRSIRAFMACIDTLSFQTQRGETGQAIMKDFCFQFVSRFNASHPPDFNAAKHQTTNKLFYPVMTARMQTETSRVGRKLTISAEISGFVLDLDPSITAYAFAVADVFRQGKQGVERLAAGLPRATSDLDEPMNLSTEKKLRPERKAVNLSTEIHGSLKFSSGSIRLHGTPMRDMSQYSTLTPDWLGLTYQIFDPDVEQFNLPELSVHCDYLARACEPGINHDTEDTSSRILMFKSTVHSSSNTLRPSLLPFLTQLVHNIEERMRASSTSDMNLRPPSSRDVISVYSSDEPPRSATTRRAHDANGLQIIFSLRIDKSHLELTCKPDVNVVARLHWESGGFLINVSPGSRGVSVSASIGGLTVGLRHGFLNEDSTSINARNLNFSVNFSKSALHNGQLVNSVSVVVETEVAGSIRFTRFQDFLCFKAVWLDHIPIFKGDAVQKTKTSSRMTLAPSTEQAQKQGIDTAIIIRVRQIRLEADLGQSISTVAMELQSATVRTRITDEVSELSVSVERVDTQARGNLSGHLRMPDFLFRTVRKRQDTQVDKQPLGRMLELFLTSGTLDIQLQSDWLWLLQYRAEPFQAMVYDDWPTMTAETSTKDRQLQLSFTVTGSKVTAMLTTMAIPKLVVYAGKFMENLESQREGASRESSAFRSARLPKPDNALSEVAHAMYQTARTKLKESESLSYVIGQRMSLDLGELVFVLLPRSQGDHELARFIGRDIKAQLRRTVRPDGLPTHRDLRLSMSHMSISQLIKQGFDPSLPGQEFDVLTETNRRFGGVENVIFSLPAIDMRMVSDEELQNGMEVLPYDFESTFVRLEGQRRLENISISFNIGLYSWLTVLRKTFTRELKRAQEVADWRAGVTTSTPSYTPRLGSPPMAPSPLALDRAPSPIRSKSLESVFIPSSPGKRMSATRSTMLLPSPRIISPELPRSSSFRLPDSGTDTVPNSPTSKTLSSTEKDSFQSPASGSGKKSAEIVYKVRKRRIERLTVRQLGEATPDVMHPFFTKKAGFNLEESLPQYVHEYATLPIEEIMKALVKLYSKQLKIGR